MDRSAYCTQVLSRLRRLSRREREAVRAELQQHIEDKAAGLMRSFPDMEEREAGERALNSMGDAWALKQELARVHSPWLGYLWRFTQVLVWGTLAAVLILLACYVTNSLAQKALQKNGHKALALGSKFAIYGIGAFMILSELAIAQELVNTAFILIVAALAAAFALSFGIGGREFAGRMLEKLEDSVSNQEVPKE